MLKIEPKWSPNRRKMGHDRQWNVDRHQDDQKIEKISDLERYKGVWPNRFRAQGPAVGGRGDNKLSPGTENREIS